MGTLCEIRYRSVDNVILPGMSSSVPYSVPSASRSKYRTDQKANSIPTIIMKNSFSTDLEFSCFRCP